MGCEVIMEQTAFSYSHLSEHWFIPQIRYLDGKKWVKEWHASQATEQDWFSYNKDISRASQTQCSNIKVEKFRVATLIHSSIQNYIKKKKGQFVLHCLPVIPETHSLKGKYRLPNFLLSYQEWFELTLLLHLHGKSSGG